MSKSLDIPTATPLPKGSPAPGLWQTARYILNPDHYTRLLMDRYGAAFWVRSGMGDSVAITSAEYARQVFAADAEAFSTTPLTTDIFGANSVLAAWGGQHRRQRKLMNPRFNGARMKAFLGTMQRVTHEHLARLDKEPGAVLVMSERAQALTVDIIVETVFGADPLLERERGRVILSELVASVVPSVIASVRFRQSWFPPWQRFQAARRRFDAWITEMMANRRNAVAKAGADGKHADDILGVLLEARYEDGEPMPDAEIGDQLFTLLIAGHETTATAIAWGVHYFATTPRVLGKLRDEIAKLGPSPTPEALVRLPYLEAVTSEALRIQPIITDVTRVCNRDFALGPHVIPAGTVILVLLCRILHDESLYPDPKTFRPERFIERTFSGAEFVPFGGGNRRCLGAAFAEAELNIVLGTIAAEWDIASATGGKEKAVRKNLAMGPKSGVRVRMSRRT